MTPSSWPTRITRVVLLGVDFPVAAGGSTYIENLGIALESSGIQTEVVSIYRGDLPTSLPHHVIFRRKALQAAPVIGDHVSFTDLHRLPLVAFKRLDRRLSLLTTRRLFESYGSDTLVIVTHVKALIILKESGFHPARSRATFVGQHHSPFVSVHEEPGLIDALPTHFSELSAFTALSHDDAKQFEELIGVPCIALPNPSRPESHHADPPLLTRTNRVVALARYSPEKRLGMLIDAFATCVLNGSIDGWRLDLYGEGPEEAKLRAQIDRLSADTFISVRGRTDDVHAVLRDSQLNILTSRFEGFGMSILEAGSHGTPSIASASTAGVIELTTTLGGRLVAPGDSTALENSLVEILNDPILRESMGSSALVGSTEYSGPRVVARWGEFLSSLRL